jgi:hypothetical protein
MQPGNDLELVRGLLRENPARADTVARGEERLATLMATDDGAGVSRRVVWRRSWHASRRTLFVAGLAGVTAGAVAVAMSGTAPVARSKQPSHPAATPESPALSARTILLTAAVNAAKARATGRYWVLDDTVMQLQAAGTAAHPYNIADRSRTQSWYPRSAGQRFWYLTTDLGAKPATPADRAAWRAVGSPTVWHFGGGGHGKPEETFRTSRSPTQAYWEPRVMAPGMLGNARATFAKLQSLPSNQAKLTALIRRYALWPAKKAAAWLMASQMFDTAVWLLTQPVTPQVHAAVYKVIAGLPGVRAAGIMTDPLGRRGYGISIYWGSGQREVIVVSPSTGALLADEFLVSTPGRTTVESWWSTCGYLHMLKAKTAAQRAAIRRMMPPRAVCARLARDGSRYVQYSPQYQGQVARYDAYGRVGWSNTGPRLPGARFAPSSAKG